MNLKIKALLLAAALAVGGAGHSKAQMQPGQSVVPVGVCQIAAASLSSSVGLSACLGASFTGTCTGTSLAASSVAGSIRPGQVLAGTGITAGTTVVSGPAAGGAGTYVTSAPCTSSAQSLTASGIPTGANAAMIQGETANVRWRDDGGAPTTSVGMILVSGQAPVTYAGTLSALRFIAATGSPLVNVSFYRAP